MRVRLHRFSAAACVLSLLLMPAAPSPGATFAQLESAYQGDGWFEYRVTMFQEPFFRTQCLTGAYTSSFTNRNELGSVPADWTFYAEDDHTVSWSYNGTEATQAVPCTQSFYARSTEQHFKTVTNFYLFYLLWPQHWLHSPYLTDNMAGFVKLPALVPCPPPEEDGSPSNLVASFEMLPDVTVEDITPLSISYSWGPQYTVLISASTNLVNWTNVTYALGYEGITTWTSPVPLTAYGSAFRVGLVSARHETNW